MSTKTEITKVCVDCKEEFIIDSGDLTLYEKVGLKIPEWCFFCRTKQYFAFFVFGKFRKGVSDLSGESLITVLPSNARYPIYKSHEWWGDGWDAISFGKDYDPSKPFFDQLRELQEKIPRPHQVGENNTNCDWCDDAWESKNCYLTRSFLKCENVSYGHRVIEVKDSLDIVYSSNLQNSYDCLFCYSSFNLNFSENSKDCIESYFLFDCRNCQNCFMCWNLRNKQYCIRNKQYIKEEYEKELKNIKLDSYKNVENLKVEFEDILKQKAVHRENFNLKKTNSVGNYMTNCDKCVNVFTVDNSQNCRNSLRGINMKDCIDQANSWADEMSGNNSGVTGGYQIKYSSWSDARYSEYLDMCIECEYCFGCIGLRKKKHCILNKQYAKNEYNELKEKIIQDMENKGEYGKFLPYSMGLCGYNFSTSFLYFSDTKKEDILRLGGYWEDIKENNVEGMPTNELPDDIKDVPDNIISQALICGKSGWRFNISFNELIFYKENNIPLPRYHFDVRIKNSLKYLTILQSYPYKCSYCKKDIEAYYLPEWNYQKIACEECYKQNIN